MTNHNPNRREKPGRSKSLTGVLLLLLVAPAALSLLGGCEINKPEMPTFDTSLTIPLGVERIDILEVIEDEDFLEVADDGGLSFFIEGDPDTMSFDFELSADIGAQTIEQGLGNFELAALDPMSYAFELGDIWAPATGANNLLAIVPGFPINVSSGSQNIPDVESATLTSGSVSVTLINNLPVPVGAASGPDQIIMNLEDPGSGAVFATFVFPEIASGANSTQTNDLAGVTLPGNVRVSLAGGSLGSNGQPVIVNGSDSITIDAQFNDLVVSSANAVIGAQTFQTSFETELPEDFELEHAIISSGLVGLNITNDMPLPAQAVLTWNDLHNLQGTPLSVTFNLAAGQSESRDIDFTGYILSSVGEPLLALEAIVDINTPGSSGTSVTMNSGSGLTADLVGGTISFSSVTGLVPAYSVPVDPIIEEIDLPDEMDGLELVAASMVLHVTNSAGLPANLDMTLSGTSASGGIVTMLVNERILPAESRATVTDIVLNESNSSIVDFLNNLPTTISLAGNVDVGGHGTSGTVHADDFAIVSWDIIAPMEVIITGTTLDSDPSALDLDLDMRDMISDHAMGAEIQTEILNHFPMAVELFIKAGTDTSTIASAPLLEIGPLMVSPGVVDPITHVVSQSVISTPQIMLTLEDAKIFARQGLHTLVEVRLPSSNGNPVRMLSTDYLEVRGIIQMEVKVNDDW